MSDTDIYERFQHDPRIYIRNMFNHPNDRSRGYDFYTDDGDDFLYYIVDDEGPLNPEQWGDINVLLFARGCLKTWSCTSIAAWALDVFDSMEITATAPRDDQRDEVIEEFKKRINDSGFVNNRVKDNVSHQKFEKTIEDEDGNDLTVTSSLKSRSAWGGGDALRGLHSQGGIIDESQDVDEGTFSTFMEAIDQSVPDVEYWPSIFVIGTPKMANSFFHKLWKMSDQKTWDEDSHEWIQQSEADDFLPAEVRQRKTELKDELSELRGLDSDEYDELITEYENELDAIGGYSVRGWHVDQYNSPLHDESRINFKKETYSPQKFQNEVKAQFYSPESDLIVEDDVWNAFASDEPFSYSDPEAKTVMGLDWGGGDSEGAAATAFVIADYYDDGSFVVRNINTFDRSLTDADEVRRVETLLHEYQVDECVVDEGYGDTNRAALQDGEMTDTEDGYPNIVHGCRYGNVKNKDELKWNRFKNDYRYFTCNRNYVIKEFVTDFKQEKVHIPSKEFSFDSRHELGTQVLDQLTAPYSDRIETANGKKKLKIQSDRNDDIFHAFVYMYLAATKVSIGGMEHRIITNNRSGY